MTRTNKTRHVAVGTTKKSAATDLPEVIREKGAPGLRGWPAVANHVFPDAGLTDINPELQQFAMDPRRLRITGSSTSGLRRVRR